MVFNNNTKKNPMKSPIDVVKRDALVKKYDLMNFAGNKHMVLLSIDEFFDGNNDEASIAPNISVKPEMAQYYKVLKTLSKHPKIVDAFVEIKDVMIYDDGKLHDNDWFYTDVAYFVGDLTKEEVREAVKSLLPDEVEYDTDNRISNFKSEYKDKKIVFVWWD